MKKLMVAVVAVWMTGMTGGPERLAQGAEPSAVTLPPGVKAVWDLGKAYHETTPTRERICINGLWRWQPAEAQAEQTPTENWGYFKVPGCWPGITDYMQKDCQTVYAHPSWKDRRLGDITAAWYQREITIPARLGRPADCGEHRISEFLCGRVRGWRESGRDPVSGRRGRSHVASAAPAARTGSVCSWSPCRSRVSCSRTPTAPRPARSRARWRGAACAAMSTWSSTPSGPRIADVRVDTSVRKKEFTLDAAVEGLAPEAQYALRARIMKDGRTVKEFTSRAFQASDLKDGRIAFTEKWMPEKLWDIHTPQNQLRPGGLAAGRRGQGAGHRLAGAVRLSRVLDRGPRLLPQRHPHLSLGRAAGQRADRRRRWPPTTPPARAWSGSRASASTSSIRTTTAASRARIWASRRSCGRPTTWGCWSRSRSRTSATTTGRRPTPTAATATPATRRSTSARRRTIRPS